MRVVYRVPAPRANFGGTFQRGIGQRCYRFQASHFASSFCTQGVNRVRW